MTETLKLKESLVKEKKPQFKAAPEVVREVEKEAVAKVPDKVQKKIARKVAACISAGLVASTGGFIALGETGNLPEKVQEWYDETSQPIRKMFGIEEAGRILTKLSTESKNQAERPFTGLEIEGLNHVWQNGRWEYVDPDDNLVAGYWNDKERKYKHTADVLKGEWKGLFVSVEQEKQILIDNLKNETEWSKENWENGSIKIPILADMSRGGTIEQRNLSGALIAISGGPVKFIAGRGFPDGTILFVPFTAEDIEQLPHGVPKDFGLHKGSLLFSTIFASPGQFLLSESVSDGVIDNLDPLDLSTNVRIGTPFLSLDDKNFLAKEFLLRFSFLAKGDYQFILTGQCDLGPLSFSFDNFLRDTKGRLFILTKILKKPLLLRRK